MHPAKIQLRGFDKEELSKIVKRAVEFGANVIELEHGTDLFFEDVEDARIFISKLQREFRFEKKMSTESLGFKKGRGRYLFVYSLRKA